MDSSSVDVLLACGFSSIKQKFFNTSNSNEEFVTSSVSDISVTETKKDNEEVKNKESPDEDEEEDIVSSSVCRSSSSSKDSNVLTPKFIIHTEFAPVDSKLSCPVLQCPRAAALCNYSESSSSNSDTLNANRNNPLVPNELFDEEAEEEGGSRSSGELVNALRMVTAFTKKMNRNLHVELNKLLEDVKNCHAETPSLIGDEDGNRCYIMPHYPNAFTLTMEPGNLNAVPEIDHKLDFGKNVKSKKKIKTRKGWKKRDLSSDDDCDVLSHGMGELSSDSFHDYQDTECQSDEMCKCDDNLLTGDIKYQTADDWFDTFFTQGDSAIHEIRTNAARNWSWLEVIDKQSKTWYHTLFYEDHATARMASVASACATNSYTAGMDGALRDIMFRWWKEKAVLESKLRCFGIENFLNNLVDEDYKLGQYLDTLLNLRQTYPDGVPNDVRQKAKECCFDFDFDHRDQIIRCLGGPWLNANDSIIHYHMYFLMSRPGPYGDMLSKAAGCRAKYLSNFVCNHAASVWKFAAAEPHNPLFSTPQERILALANHLLSECRSEVVRKLGWMEVIDKRYTKRIEQLNYKKMMNKKRPLRSSVEEDFEEGFRVVHLHYHYIDSEDIMQLLKPVTVGQVTQVSVDYLCAQVSDTTEETFAKTVMELYCAPSHKKRQLQQELNNIYSHMEESMEYIVMKTLRHPERWKLACLDGETSHFNFDQISHAYHHQVFKLPPVLPLPTLPEIYPRGYSLNRAIWNTSYKCGLPPVPLPIDQIDLEYALDKGFYSLPLRFRYMRDEAARATRPFYGRLFEDELKAMHYYMVIMAAKKMELAQGKHKKKGKDKDDKKDKNAKDESTSIVKKFLANAVKYNNLTLPSKYYLPAPYRKSFDPDILELMNISHHKVMNGTQIQEVAVAYISAILRVDLSKDFIDNDSEDGEDNENAMKDIAKELGDITAANNTTSSTMSLNNNINQNNFLRHSYHQIAKDIEYRHNDYYSTAPPTPKDTNRKVGVLTKLKKFVKFRKS